MRKDIMGRATARVSERVTRVTQRFTEELMPIGPDAAEMTPAELKNQLNSMSGEQRLALSKVIGEERMMEMMRVASEA